MRGVRVLVCGALMAGAVSAGPALVNVLSLQEGALAVIVPRSYEGWPAELLLDESPATGWASEVGMTHDNVFVFELVGPSVIERFRFDVASVDVEGAGARRVIVEASVASKVSGFVKVLEATLRAGRDGQEFTVAPVPARWIRLTVVDNHGNEEWTELFSFKAFGTRPEPTPIGDVSGTYATDYGDFHIRQTGTLLRGCYDSHGGLLDGTIEGRLMKLTWTEGQAQGPAVMVFTPEGTSFIGFWWYRGSESGGPAGRWDGRKKSPTVGRCPHWSGSLEAELHEGLKAKGRVRLYGILFELDSDAIRQESHASLDEVVRVLRAEPSWKLLIEGHTDSLGSDSYNKALSLRRAQAVKAYLVSHGIAEERLRVVGLGESSPVADNGTELGPAQNRRVELVKE